MSRADNRRKLWNLIKDVKIAMLTTVHNDDTVHSRPMATQRAEFDGDLWFFTSRNTEKCFDVEQEKHVNVSYAAPDDQRYVSVSGRAKVVVDRDKARELWHPGLKAYFPDGAGSRDLALIRVKVDSAEYWDSPTAPIVRLVGFVKALAAGARYEPGENETLDFRGWFK